MDVCAYVRSRVCVCMCGLCTPLSQLLLGRLQQDRSHFFIFFSAIAGQNFFFLIGPMRFGFILKF